ncbi:MAG TPA: Ig-like domain-containing protein, partial [Vicinamibacterales bacterium]
MVRAALALSTLLFTALPVHASQASRAPAALTVVSTAPAGEIATLAEANEIRIVFSEPMVTLGRIPAVVRAPFFKIAPAVSGTFRWSGPTILIFTPDPKKPLPYATAYEVTIDTTATAVSGRTLARPVSFRFTTPTVKLLSTEWYRRGNNVANDIVVLLRFNQPVRSADVAAHAKAALEPHDWTAPSFSAEEQARLKAADPQALDRFAAKVAATRAVSQATTAVGLRPTTDWDKKRYPVSRDLVVLETTTAVQPESWVQLTVDGTVPSPAGAATPGKDQSFTIQVEPAFFIDGFYCRAECDPDAWNPVRMRREVNVKAFAASLTAVDITA